MMINSLNNNQSGYHNRNQCISIQCGGEYERNASRPSGRKESREAALTRRIRQLEQRVFALEEMLLKADTMFRLAGEKQNRRMQAVALCLKTDYYYYTNKFES